MTECGIEILKNGTETCPVHKEPLQDITAFDEVVNGEYKEMVNTYFCPIGRKQLTTPFTFGKSRRAQ
jgi:hypothetical protein